MSKWIVTADYLRDQFACDSSIRYFKKKYGKSTRVTEKKLVEVLLKHMDWVHWIILKFVQDKRRRSLIDLVYAHGDEEDKLRPIARAKLQRENIRKECKLIYKHWRGPE